MIENADLSTKAIAVTFRSLQLSSAVVFSALEQFHDLAYKQVHTGKQSLKALVRSGKQLQSFDAQLPDLKEFEKLAKQNHLDYTIVQNKDGPDSYTIFFKITDMALFRNALQNLIASRIDGDPEQTRESVKSMVEQIKANQKLGIDADKLAQSTQRVRDRRIAR